MKIVFTGGGSGGHFYPVIAVAQALNGLVREKKLLSADMFYLAPSPYDPGALFENNIVWRKVPAGKIRRYVSLLNITDMFKTGWGIVKAFFTLYSIYPDVVFGKGGYASFPVLIAARFFNIPVVIHESDSVPGKVNLWAGKFAERIAVSYGEAGHFFPSHKVAHTGNPIRKELTYLAREGAYEFLKLEEGIPVILVLGGSQGAELINDTILDALPILLEKYQVIHQTGAKHLSVIEQTSEIVLGSSRFRARYRPFGHLNTLALKMAAGIATLVVSRAGSTIFEIASWGTPSIVIPITASSGDHQRKNAFNYSRADACVVIEENNLTPHILISEINRLMERPEEMERMRRGAEAFAMKDAAILIADEIIGIALRHER